MNRRLIILSIVQILYLSFVVYAQDRGRETVALSTESIEGYIISFGNKTQQDELYDWLNGKEGIYSPKYNFGYDQLPYFYYIVEKYESDSCLWKDKIDFVTVLMYRYISNESITIPYFMLEKYDKGRLDFNFAPVEVVVNQALFLSPWYYPDYKQSFYPYVKYGGDLIVKVIPFKGSGILLKYSYPDGNAEGIEIYGNNYKTCYILSDIEYYNPYYGMDFWDVWWPNNFSPVE